MELQDQLISMFNSSNIKELSKNFDKRIKVTVDNEENIYSNVQAEIVLRNFLIKLEDKKFCCIKRLDIDEETFYITGKLTSTSGTYKTFIFLSEEEDAEIIREIKFEKI
jgi:hypothetical protein